MKKYIYLFAIASLFFAACSKDSGTAPEEKQIIDDPAPKDNSLVGVFKDAVVQGLSYETATHSGVTNEKGEFLYEEGETVTFKIGTILLGEVRAKALITPIDLIKEGVAALTNIEAKNIAALLQTLDSDADHSNGITILNEVTNALSISSIDFAKPIESLLADIVTEVSQKTKVELLVVLPEQAALDMAVALGVTYTSENYAQTHLIPFLSTFFSNSPKNLILKHNFDQTGKLIDSEVSYRYSGRKSAIYKYGDYQSNLLPTSMVRTAIHPLKEYTPSLYTFTYNDEQYVTNLKLFDNRTGYALLHLRYSEWNNQNHPIALSRIRNDESIAYRRTNSYDDQGNLIITEDIFEINGNSTTKEHTYDQWGNLNETNEKNTKPDLIWTYETTYTYRENHTKESRTKTSTLNNSLSFITTEQFDDEEFLHYVELNGIASDELTTFTYNKGIITESEHYKQDVLYSISEYPLNGTTYTMKYFISSEDYAYYIEYKYQGGYTLIKTEYYDENDLLLRTELPDSGKNITQQTLESSYDAEDNFMNEFNSTDLNF